MSEYNVLAGFAQIWGMLYFILIFLGILIYAFWPRNKKPFEEASQIPLRED